jgi:hypothetical protein
VHRLQRLRCDELTLLPQQIAVGLGFFRQSLSLALGKGVQILLVIINQAEISHESFSIPAA